MLDQGHPLPASASLSLAPLVVLADEHVSGMFSHLDHRGHNYFSDSVLLVIVITRAAALQPVTPATALRMNSKINTSRPPRGHTHAHQHLQMSDAPLVALVVGGTGVVGRYLLKHLASPASCFQLCYSCSRRAADVDDVSLSAKLRSVQVDLLKADGAEERSSALAPLGVTHMFFAGYSGSVEVGRCWRTR